MTQGIKLGFKLKNMFFELLKKLKNIIHIAKHILKSVDNRIKRISPVMMGFRGISGNRLTSWIYPLQTPLVPDVEKGWKPYHLFEGFTSEMKSLTCHASVLVQEHRPHPPHRHKEEEILLLLDGEVDLIVPNGLTPHEIDRRRLKPGEFVYYPSNFAHTLQTVSEVPANYVMYKWYANYIEKKAMQKFSCYNGFKSFSNMVGKGDFCTNLLFEGPTAFLKKLHCHISTLSPQKGYEPHADDYDVSIVVLEGEVETLGKRVCPYNIIYYAAGEPHGMYNPGEVTAKYIVFEFHGHPSIPMRIIERFVSIINRFCKNALSCV